MGKGGWTSSPGYRTPGDLTNGLCRPHADWRGNYAFCLTALVLAWRQTLPLVHYSPTEIRLFHKQGPGEGLHIENLFTGLLRGPIGSAIRLTSQWTLCSPFLWDQETKGIPFFFLPKGLLPLPLFLTHDSTPMEDGHWECQLSFRKGSEPTWSRPIPYGLTLVSTKWRFQGIIVYWYKRSLCNSKGWEKESRGLFSFTRRMSNLPIKGPQDLDQCLAQVCALSCVWLFVTPQTVACQTPLSMGFSRQKYWSVLPFPTPGDLPDPENEPKSLESPQEIQSALAGRFFTPVPPGKPTWHTVQC